jgi:hypothetical protein
MPLTLRFITTAFGPFQMLETAMAGERRRVTYKLQAMSICDGEGCVVVEGVVVHDSGWDF